MAMLCCVTCADPNLQEKAQALARHLNLTFYAQELFASRYALNLSEAGLQLESHPSLRQNPIKVDFTSGKMGHRLAQAEPKQGLAQALGLKKGYRPTIIDATAGLGGDSLVISRLGCSLTLIERSPIIAALLADGLERARASEALQEIVNRMTLIVEDASHFISCLPENSYPQVIYLDPMYPDDVETKALNKKEMRVLKELVGPDLDSQKLLEISLKRCLKRVVVKRPKLARVIGNMSPTYVVKGKSTRYDVYLISPIKK